MAFLFKDLYKPVKNVISSGYGSEGVEVNLKTISPSGTKISSTGIRSSSGALAGDLEWKQNFVKNDKTFGVTGKLDNDGTVNASVDVLGLTKGFLVTAEGAMHTTEGEKNGDKIKLAAEYLHDKVATAADVSFSRSSKPITANVSTLAAHEGLFLGGAAALNLKNASGADVLSNYDLGVRYSREKLDIALQLEQKLSNVKVGVAHQVRNDLSVAMQFSQKLKYAAEEKRSPAVWTLGLSKAIDADSSVKAKVDTTGTAAAVYSLQLNKDLKTNVTVTTDVRDTNKGSRVGVSFDYTPLA